MTERDGITEIEAEKPQFVVESFPSRTTILDLALRLEPDFYNRLADDPEGWVEELSGLHQMFTGQHLARGFGFEPHFDDEAMHLISEDVAIATEALDRRQNGLWIQSKEGWYHLGIGHNASLKKTLPFEGIDSRELLPETFVPTGQILKEEKRPIIKFGVTTPKGETTVIAKGSATVESMYFPDKKPSSRKTRLAGVNVVDSKEELNRFQVLAKNGVSVPEIIGYYESSAEQWLFVKEVVGLPVTEWLDDEEAVKTIIAQDAEMLAILCRVGFKKQGFNDHDDKLFDGENLFLIDTDEIIDLYYQLGMAFRETLLNPCDETMLVEFRDLQRQIFLKELKDAIYLHKGTLLNSDEQILDYIGHFMNVLDWHATDKEMEYLLDFEEENYMTRDQFNSLMSDTD